MLKLLIVFVYCILYPFLSVGMNKKNLSNARGNGTLQDTKQKVALIQEKEKKEKIKELMEIFSDLSPDIKPEELLQDPMIENILCKLIELEAWSEVEKIINNASTNQIFCVTAEAMQGARKLKLKKELDKIKYLALLIEKSHKNELKKFFDATSSEHEEYVRLLMNAHHYKAVLKLVSIYPLIDEDLIVQAMSLRFDDEYGYVLYIIYLLENARSLQWSKLFFQKDEGKKLIHLLVKYEQTKLINKLGKQGFVAYYEDVFLPYTWNDVDEKKREIWLTWLDDFVSKNGGFQHTNGTFLYKPKILKLIKKFITEMHFDLLFDLFKAGNIVVNEKAWKKYCLILDSLKKQNKEMSVLLSSSTVGGYIKELIDEKYVSILGIAFHVFDIEIHIQLLVDIVNNNKSLQTRTIGINNCITIQNEMVKHKLAPLIRHSMYIPALMASVLNDYESDIEIIVKQIVSVKKEYELDIKSLEEQLIKKGTLTENVNGKIQETNKVNSQTYYDLLSDIILLGLEELGDRMPFDAEYKIKKIKMMIDLLEKHDAQCINLLHPAYKRGLLFSATLVHSSKLFDYLLKTLTIDPLGHDEAGNIITECIIEDYYDETSIIKGIKFLSDKIGQEKLLTLINPQSLKKNPLCLAAEKGKWNLVNFLLEQGADPSISNEEYHNLMYKIVSDSSLGRDGSDRRNIFLNDKEKLEWISRLVDHVGEKKVSDLFVPKDGGVVPLLAAISYKNAKIFNKMIESGATLHDLSGNLNIIGYMFTVESCSPQRRIELMQFIFDNSDIKSHNLLLAPVNTTSPIVKALMLNYKEELAWMLKKANKEEMEEAILIVMLIPSIIINKLDDNQFDKLALFQQFIDAAKEAEIFEKLFNLGRSSCNPIEAAYKKNFSSLAQLLLKNGIKPRLCCDINYLNFIAKCWQEVYLEKNQPLDVFNDKKMWALMSVIYDQDSYKKIISTLQESGIIVPIDIHEAKEEMFNSWVEEFSSDEYKYFASILTSYFNKNQLTVNDDSWIIIENKFMEWAKTHNILISMVNGDVKDPIVGIDEKKLVEQETKDVFVQNNDNDAELHDLSCQIIEKIEYKEVEVIGNNLLVEDSDKGPSSQTLDQTQVSEILINSNNPDESTYQTQMEENLKAEDFEENLPSGRDVKKRMSSRDSLLDNTENYNKDEFECMYDVVMNSLESKIIKRRLEKQLPTPLGYFSQQINQLSCKIGLIKDHLEELNRQIILKEKEIAVTDFLANQILFSENLGSRVLDSVHQKLVFVNRYIQFAHDVDVDKDFLQKEFLELIEQQKDVTLWLAELEKQKNIKEQIRIMIKEQLHLLCVKEKKMALREKYEGEDIEEEGRWSREVKDPRAVDNNNINRHLILRGLDLA